MNALNRVALRGMRNSRARTLVTVLGVALSAALIAAVGSFAVSLRAYMAAGAVQRYGAWHAALPSVPEGFLEAQAADPRVEAVALWQNLGYARIEDSRNPKKPYLFVAALGDDALDLAAVRLYAGRLPESDAEAIVPAHLGSDGGVSCALGDTLTLRLGQREAAGKRLNQLDAFRGEEEQLAGLAEKTYRVVGVYQRLSAEPASAPGYTVITRPRAGASPVDCTALVALRRPAQLRAYLKEVAPAGDALLNDNTLRFLGLSEDRLFNALLYAVGGVLVALVLLGAVFLIYNAFNISLGERVRQFGLLLSVGATPGQLRRSVLFEGLCVGAMGIPAGLLLGLIAMGLLLRVVEGRFTAVLYSGVPLRLILSPGTLAAAAGVSLMAVLVSAWIPARRAAARPVLDCLRQGGEDPAAETARSAPRLERLLGVNGALAMKRFRRDGRRHRAVALSLTLSVVLTVSASAFGASLERLSDRAYVYTDYDIAVSAPDMDDAELAALFETLRGVEGVKEGICQETRDYAVTADAALLTDTYWEAVGRSPAGAEALTAEVTFLDDDAYRALLGGLGLSEEALGDDRCLALGKVFVETGRSREVEDVPELFTVPEPRLTLRGEGGAERPVTLALASFVPPDTPPALFALSQTAYLAVFAPWSARGDFPPSSVRARGLTLTSDAPGPTVERVNGVIDGLGLAGECTVLNVHGLLEQSRAIVFVARLFSIIFLAVIALIAAANVYNTIATSLRLRRRELAMLRSVGQGDRDFRGMLRFECLLYVGRALLWGLPLSTLASWAIHRIIDEDGVPFALPWRGMLFSAVGAALMVGVAMALAARRLAGENIAEAMRDDMA